MILSRTSQYAVQALIYMVIQPTATPVLNKDIAAQLGVPAPYLAKILQSLAKGNLLFSFRGRLGGFCLRDGGEKITYTITISYVGDVDLNVRVQDALLHVDEMVFVA